MRTLIASAIAALIVAPAPVIAQYNSGSEVTATVWFHDLDLKTSAGVRLLNRRISSAIEAVCGSYANTDSVEQDVITECRRRVRQSVGPQIDSAIKSSEVRYAEKETGSLNRESIARNTMPTDVNNKHERR